MIGDGAVLGGIGAEAGPAVLSDETSGGLDTQVNVAEFAPLGRESGRGDMAGLDLLLDFSLQVSVELGRARMTIGDVLALRVGSVVELDKLAGEPADILVNGSLIARGEVVVVDEKFGVRVVEVVSGARRLATLS